MRLDRGRGGGLAGSPAAIRVGAEAAVDLGGETLRYIANLEHELEFAKRSLQDTIEALETTNEELQSTNEELLTANEELQSTNEELQSVNEELYTVNAEHKLKITQLTESSDDFENLLAVAGLHAIFLDSALRVRRFSRGPAPFHLVEADVGRPIHHLALELDFPDFALTIQEVLQTLLPVRRVCGAPDGRSFRVDVVPYRTGDSEIRGAVVAMVDITAPLDETPEPRG
ncbi:MAG: PAS domain-containing protein [Myxococcales bacterium]|nr:PAS domain-containing protein [Myxococcales bacterium]